MLLACDGVEAAVSLAVELHSLVFEGTFRLMASPATKIPSHWADDLYGAFSTFHALFILCIYASSPALLDLHYRIRQG